VRIFNERFYGNEPLVRYHKQPIQMSHGGMHYEVQPLIVNERRSKYYVDNSYFSIICFYFILIHTLGLKRLQPRIFAFVLENLNLRPPLVVDQRAFRPARV